jgi:hypothetical protein
MSEPAPEIVTSASTHVLKHEYYLLRDDREESQFLAWAMMFDIDPARTELLIQNYQQRVKEKYPDWVIGRYNPDCAGGGAQDIRLSNGELSPIQAFKRKAPTNISHFERVQVIGPNLCSTTLREYTFDCVSHEWKDAIDNFEPGMHEFHPLALQFDDGVKFDRFIFRTVQIDDIVDHASSDVRLVNGHSVGLNFHPAFITLRRVKTRARHWLMQRELGGDAMFGFASAPLATRLRPLLPRNVRLQSVKLS